MKRVQKARESLGSLQWLMNEPEKASSYVDRDACLRTIYSQLDRLEAVITALKKGKINEG